MSDPSPALPRSGRRRARRWAGQSASAVLLVGVAVFAYIALRNNWDAVRDDLGRFRPTDYLFSGVAAVGGLLLLFETWYRTLRSLGGTMRRHDALTTFFAGQVGKYVPGSVWPAVIQAQLGRRNGVPRATMVASYLLFMSLFCAVGGLVGVATLVGSSSELAWWVLAGAAVAGAAGLVLIFHERGLIRWFRWALAKGGRSSEVHLRRGPAAEAVGVDLVMWVVFGIHAWILARPLGADTGDLVLSVGAFSLAWVAGVLVVPLPAGAGVRETVLVLTLGVAIGRPAAITVALVSRLMLIALELLIATLVGVPAAIRWSRQSQSADTGTSST